MRGVKRPRHSPPQQQAQQLSPMKALLVQAARVAAALPPPPPEPEPEGPKCGICMEVRRRQGWCRGRRAWERRQADRNVAPVVGAWLPQCNAATG